MQVKIQSLLKSILIMSLILQTTGCIKNTSDTPSIAQKDTSPLPSAISNVNNIKGKWRTEYTTEVDNQAVPVKFIIEYLPGNRYNLQGEISRPWNHEGKNYTVNYNFFGHGTWSIDKDYLIETPNDLTSSLQSITVDGKTTSRKDIAPEIIKEIPSIESAFAESEFVKSRIISLSPSEMKLEVFETNETSSIMTHYRV